MKKVLLSLAIIFTISATTPVFAHHCSYHAYYSHHSCPVYLVDQEVLEEESPFHECDSHSLLTQRTINYYSNGVSRSFVTYSILNESGEIISGNYSEVKHLKYNNEHYFIVKQKKNYKILNQYGYEISKRVYTEMFEIAPNKLVVKSDKKYGIIDLDDNIIVPIKYKKFERLSENAFLTKLNGYWGIVDSNNNVLIKNDCDEITHLYDTLLIKRYGKFGLATLDGKTIIYPECKKIKKFAEYILVKRDKKYGLYNSSGEKITDIKYKKIRIDHNNVQGYINKHWETINL